MKIVARAHLAGVSLLLSTLAAGCGDSSSHGMLSPTQPNYATVVVKPYSIPVPPDDCNANPTGYGCNKTPQTSYTSDYARGCPAGCSTRWLTTGQKGQVSGALSHIDTSDLECVALANYATHLMNIDHIQWYHDPNMNTYGSWADIHYNTANGYNDNPWMHLSDWALNNSGGELTKTLLHEAVHGYYGIDDSSGVPEATAQRCYKW